MKVEIRLHLHVEHGVCGNRLQRGEPLPISEFHFPATAEGKKQALEAQAKMQDYVDKFHNAPKKKGGRA